MSTTVKSNINENIDNIDGLSFAAKCGLRGIYNNMEKNNGSLTKFWAFLNYSAVWDNVYCWPPTPPGKIVTKHCADIFKDLYPALAVHLEGHARKECLGDGRWAQGNASSYVECIYSVRSYLERIEEEKYLIRMAHYILFVGSILSLVSLGISLAIFYFFRYLRCDRVTVQVHLMLSLVLRFVFMFIITEPYVLGHRSSFRDVEILCESILVLFLFSTFASVSWMFNQGLFLNLSLMVDVITIRTSLQFTIYYIIGWGIPTAFMVVYVIAMLLKEQEKCWDGYLDKKEIWILHGPIIFELVSIGIFLLNILRILNKKIRNSNARLDTSKLKATAKATTILFPILGINNLLLFYNPGGSYNKYFVALNSFFGSTQGIWVSIVYCFTNKEVYGAIRRSLTRRNVRSDSTVRRSLPPVITMTTFFIRRPTVPSVNV